MQERRRITVTGIVQGVGFRPFIFQHASRLGLVGWVCNGTGGVSIEVQGASAALDELVDVIQQQPPPLSRIDHIVDVECEVDPNGSCFEIRQSDTYGAVHIDVSPDKKTCVACRDDILNKTSRFYQYPFTNCTHCGPRYTIVRQLPYDRAYTSMASFPLCSNCEQEYQEPQNRRYHAQPISCPNCGPQLTYFQHKDQAIAYKHDALVAAVNKIVAGGVVAIKGLGGFHLVCDATQKLAVDRVRGIKRRQRKPFALMVSNQDEAKLLVIGSKREWDILTSDDAPIVLMTKRQGEHRIASSVVFGNPYLGLMLPYTPMHLLLFDELKKAGATQALVMTSANDSGHPLATSCHQVWQQFPEQLDGVLDHDRPIVQGCDDSVVQVVADKLQVLRLARGYAPLSYPLPHCVPTTIAVGAQQKSVIALADKQHWMLSPYIGELDNLDTQQRFTETIDWFCQLYDCQPQYWVADMHRDYFSWQYAQAQTIAPLFQGSCQMVQHHYAHILSVMAEHQLTHKLLGIALDGTGLGADETIWGGEVLLADVHHYQRLGHVRTFRLIGRHKAIQEPARILYALLLEAYHPSEIQAMKIAAFACWSETQFYNLYRLWQSPVHSPLCSSAGRLFDAWAVLLGLLTELDYEGESGLLIEAGALAACEPLAVEHHCDLTFHCYHATSSSSKWSLDWLPALLQTIELLHAETVDVERVNQLCRAFCMAWAKAVLAIVERYPDYDVVLSGGVCQNQVLLQFVQQMTSGSFTHRQLYLNEKIPANDAGIAAGQLWFSIHQI
ncbi:carbamoyltransferase HypF [Vibrio mediterranei]